MRLRRIELAGFGRLSAFRAEFAPGLNVIFGQNEAGKSTLQQAVCALLYGFYDNDRARPEETVRHERFRPWPDGRAGPFRGSLEFELEGGSPVGGGRVLEVRRDFSTADVPTQLIDLVTGADVAGRYGQGRHGNVPFARRHLGMSRAVFQSCAFISQGEVFAASSGASPREIGDAIAAMADSSRRDVSAKAAMDRLEALLAKIGSDRARTAALPSAREALRVAQAELAALDASRLSVSQKAAELEAARARLSRLERELVRAQALFLAARDRSLERASEELAAADEALERARATMGVLKEFESFPSGPRDQVLLLRDRWTDAVERARRLRAELELRTGEIAEAERVEYEGLRLSVGGLSPERLEELRLKASAERRAPAGRPNVLVRILRAIGRVIGAVVRRVMGRRRVEEPGGEADALSGEGAPVSVTREEALALLEMHSRYLALRPAAEAREAAEARLREAESALAVVEAELKGILASAGMAVDRGMENAVANFLEGCRKRRLYEEAAAEEAAALDRRRLLLGERSAEEFQAQREECSRRLAALLAANPELAGLEAHTGPDELERRLEGLKSEQHSLELQATRLEEEVRGALRDHRPRAEIEEDVERWQREVARLERARAAAQMARDLIGEAMVSVYRDFAPAVNAFLSEGFEYVTEGRYRRAHVDPATLQISLLLPETDRVVSDPPVSRGTLTVAYVLMRIGLAQHMGRMGEPAPLVLDDPFVDLDQRRLQRMLEFMLRVTERAQVLLFTKDPQVLRWAEALAGDPRHRLTVLPEESLLTAAV